MGKRFASREVANLFICDYTSKTPLLHVNYANTTTTEMTSSSVYARGGWNAPKLVAFNGEIDSTFTIETQLTSFQLYKLMTGAKVSDNVKFVKRVVYTTSNGTITLDEPQAVVVDSLFAFDIDDDCGTPLAATVDYDAKTVNFGQSTEKKQYIIYYTTTLPNAQKISIKSNTFGKDVTIYGETLAKTEEGELLPYKMIIYKATPQTNITLEMANSGDPVTTTLTFDVLADDKKRMIDLILIETGIEDKDEDEDDTP